jgi:hypothetical protein
MNNQRAEQLNEFYLEQSYPTPLNPVTIINFIIAEPSHVTLKVFNAYDQVITSLQEGMMLPGNYKIDYNSSFLPNGKYFFHLQVESLSTTKKMILAL